MDMVKDEVIQKDRLSAIQESLLGFIHEEWLCQQENIIMMHPKNLIETRNLK
jgi:hypothetical protein